MILTGPLVQFKTDRAIQYKQSWFRLELILQDPEYTYCNSKTIRRFHQNIHAIHHIGYIDPHIRIHCHIEIANTDRQFVTLNKRRNIKRLIYCFKV